MIPSEAERFAVPPFEEGKNCVIGVYHHNGDHWILFMFVKSTRKLFVVDPMNFVDREQKIANNLLQWITEIHHGSNSKYGGKKSRTICSCDPEPTGWNFEDFDWSIESIQHTRQTDYTSCGLFCIQFVTSIIESYPHIPEYMNVDEDIHGMRMKNVGTLLNNSEAVEK